jgi:hypothetical protein
MAAKLKKKIKMIAHQFQDLSLIHKALSSQATTAFLVKTSLFQKML